ncbi:MAG: hypothetical protein REI94_13635 [Moraxellaceae bacterium]|nr:hypothetical protein [Moraxellaceae bacterium]
MAAWRYLVLGFGLLLATPALAQLEFDYMVGVAEDRYDTLVINARRDGPPDEAVGRFESRAREVARRLWVIVREQHPDVMSARLDVLVLPDLAVPFAVLGRGKIIADRSYALSLSDEAMAAAVAHELAHLALSHQKKRLALGMALMGSEVPQRLDQRVRLAMRLSSSPVESRAIEAEADSYALKLLHAAGLPREGLLEALLALRGRMQDEAWISDVAPRVASLRAELGLDPSTP